MRRRLCSLRSFVEVTTLMKVIIGVRIRLGILKLSHLKQLRMVLLLHFEELFTVGVIMGHCASTSVPSRILAHRRRSLLT